MMAQVQDFIYQDFIAIGGKISPGVCEIVGASSPRKWDERKGYGVSGATLVYTGRGLGKFTANFTMWDDDDLDEWEEFADMLGKEVTSRKGQSWAIAHPLVNLKPLSIMIVCVEDISQLTQMDDGGWKSSIKFIEYRAPKQIVSTPDKPTPDAPNPTASAQDKADLQIQALKAQIESLK